MENTTTTTTPKLKSNFNNSSYYFAVTFFDGENQLHLGTVEITPSLTFKALQSLLASKLCISPHQITIYFQPFYHNHNHRFNSRRRPVTSKFNFGSICNAFHSSYFFSVVQKRPRRTRRRRNNHNHNHNHNHPGENFSLLRRDEFIANSNRFDYWEYIQRLSFLEREKERYLMALSLNSNVYGDLSFGAAVSPSNSGGGYNGNSSSDGGCFMGGGDQGYNGNFSDDGVSSNSGGASSSGICDVCCSGDTVPFHWCINDAVTMVFRSAAGPIAPPTKKIDFLG